MGLHAPIAHLALGIHQDFVVVDNICGDWDFEDGGNPVVMNRVMAAIDPVLTDAWVCHLMGYAVEEVPYITMAQELGAGCADWKKAKVRELNRPEEEAVVPKNRKIVELQDAVEEVESCSACYGYLIPALDRLKEEHPEVFDLLSKEGYIQSSSSRSLYVKSKEKKVPKGRKK